MKDKPKGAMKPKKKMKHMDAKEDKKLIKKMIKKDCVK